MVEFQLSLEITPCNSLANSTLTCTPLSGFQFLIARRVFSQVLDWDLFTGSQLKMAVMG